MRDVLLVMGTGVLVFAVCVLVIPAVLDDCSRRTRGPGFIVIGYQGIGKSTLAREYTKYIDLESSCFKVIGQRAPDWFIPYCEQAYHLTRQGYIVFTSSHDVVREYFENTHEDASVPVYVCYPDKSLQVEWLRKLRRRYENTHLEKDLIAYKNAEAMYADSISKLQQSELPSIVIKNMKYDLFQFIKSLK